MLNCCAIPFFQIKISSDVVVKCKFGTKQCFVNIFFVISQWISTRMPRHPCELRKVRGMPPHIELDIFFTSFGYSLNVVCIMQGCREPKKVGKHCYNTHNRSFSIVESRGMTNDKLHGCLICL